MKKLTSNSRRNDTNIRWFALIALVACVGVVQGVEIDGFTEPHRSVDVASPEQGIVTEVPVQIGDYVSKGQVVAKLDEELHVIMLESARQRRDARGRLESAEAQLRLRETRYQKLQQLQQNGFGRKEEVDRAAADLEVAHAELKAVRDDLADKRWQFEKITAELRRRAVLAPLDGVVVARLKEPGEFVAPNEPNVVTIVELDPLIAKFSMKPSLARHLRVGDAVDVKLDESGRIVTGVVEIVSPVIDAQSGTIKLKVRINNSDRNIISGERCSINVPINDPSEREEPIQPSNKVASRS